MGIFGSLKDKSHRSLNIYRPCRMQKQILHNNHTITEWNLNFRSLWCGSWQCSGRLSAYISMRVQYKGCFLAGLAWLGSGAFSVTSNHQLNGLFQGCRNRKGGTVFWMGFYADISWESRCSSEINVWDHLCQILVVFEVPARPRVKGMSGNS